MIKKCIRGVVFTTSLLCASLLHKRDENKEFKHELAVAIIVKDEEDYIEEWLYYHLGMGVDHVYVFDNESSDRTAEILKRFEDKGYLTYTYVPGRAQQLFVYNEAIRRFKNDSRYIAFIDTDEFLFPMNKDKTLKQTIDEILAKDKKATGIAVNWCMFGSSGFETKPDGYVTQNFIRRGKMGDEGMGVIKSIVNPREVFKYNHPHNPRYFIGGYNIDELGNKVKGWHNRGHEPQLLRLNHYFTNSKEEWINRRSKGKVDTVDETDIRTIDIFYKYDHNEILDDSMYYYCGLIERMKREI